jgi:hypothetical protein
VTGSISTIDIVQHFCNARSAGWGFDRAMGGTALRNIYTRRMVRVAAAVAGAVLLGVVGVAAPASAATMVEYATVSR